MKALRRITLGLSLFMLTMSFALVTPQASVASERDYILATASTGGTYYPVGVAISTLIKVKLQPTLGIGMSAISSAGSGENILLMNNNEAQFAILQGLFGAWAWNGIGDYATAGPQREMRAVTMLWQNVEHFTIHRRHVKTGTMADLLEMQGRNMALGPRNSGTLGSNRTLLGGLGMDIDTFFSLAYAGYGPSADALQNGQVAGMSTPAGAPVSAVTRTLATMGNNAVVLDFTDEQMVAADSGMNLWTRYVIPAGTYPNQDKDINTVAQPNFLAVRADLDDDVVYQITKTIYENLPFLNAIHSATRDMHIDQALAGLPMPLHPGALRYFREVGLDVPARLIAE